jgi:hypothetical protein
MIEPNNPSPITVGVDGAGNALVRITTDSGVSITATLNTVGVTSLITLLSAAVKATHEITITQIKKDI